MPESLNIPAISNGAILGINYSGHHDSAVAIVSPTGRIEFCCSLERVSRVKKDGRVPELLLEGVPWEKIAKVAVSTHELPEASPRKESRIHPVRLKEDGRNNYLVHDRAFNRFFDGIPKEKEYVCHQESHAHLAFWLSGYDSSLCLTYDGGMHNCAYFGGLFEADAKRGIRSLDLFDSALHAKVTTLYSAVTGMLGYTPNKHEGKITGLAAYGRRDDRCRELFEDLFVNRHHVLEELQEWLLPYAEDVSALLYVNPARQEALANLFEGIKEEDIAATVQAFAEEHVVGILDAAGEQGFLTDRICLSGGLFANVKINQRVHEWGFKETFVSPPMTDDGTALGAALCVASKGEEFRGYCDATMFQGFEFGDEAIEAALDASSLTYSRVEDPEELVAEKLAEGAIVALFNGGMEYGPRALGNRSILCRATDPSINEWLNEKLNRTEFMPFAPMTRLEDCPENYIGFEGLEKTAEFMTVTCECTKAMKKTSPAVVHVDGTARPQVIVRENNPFIHAVLTKYKEKTGLSNIINTSFNMHEEPIVCSPDDAVLGFLSGGLDYLFFGRGYYVDYRENREAASEVQLRTRNAVSQGRRQEKAVVREMFGRLEELRRQTEEKESVIRDQHGSIEELGRGLEAKESLIRDQHGSIEELGRGLEAKESLIRDQNGSMEKLGRRNNEKETVIQAQSDSIQELIRHTEEKEAVIQEQHAAILEKDIEIRRLGTFANDQPRLTRLLKLIRSPYFLHRVKHLVSAHYQRLCINRRAHGNMMLRFGREGLKKMGLQPRLGDLSHHPPRQMRVPGRYLKTPRPAIRPLISIVTPSYGQVDYIEETILSLKTQGYPNLEYIVQDGGSQDGTVEILEKHRDFISYYGSKKDGGQSCAIEKGFRRSSGEIMAYLNSDDILLPGVLNYVVNYFNRHPEVDVVYGHRVLIDEFSREIGRWVLPPHEDEVLAWADYVPQETLFWRREIWERAGGCIDESFRFAMDWDLILRFREAGARFVRLPRFLGGFRVHPEQKTTTTIAHDGVAEMERLRERCIGRKVSAQEIHENIKGYLLRHMLFDRLYRTGLMRY